MKWRSLVKSQTPRLCITEEKRNKRKWCFGTRHQRLLVRIKLLEWLMCKWGEMGWKEKSHSCMPSQLTHAMRCVDERFCFWFYWWWCAFYASSLNYLVLVWAGQSWAHLYAFTSSNKQILGYWLEKMTMVRHGCCWRCWYWGAGKLMSNSQADLISSSGIF